MKGIRASLLRAFLAVIAGLFIGTVILLILNYFVVGQYKSLSDTMIAEYRLVDSLSGLIAAYNDRAISTNTDVTRPNAQLKRAKEEVTRLTTYLDHAIVDQPSKVNYLGLKNSIDTVTNTINNSLNKMSKGDIESFTADYYEANKQYTFVKDNGTTLIFSEVKYASFIRDAMDRTYLWSQILGVITLLLIIIACITYVLHFSKRLTDPIFRLQHLALLIAAGHLDVTVDSNIVAQKNELGSLAQSFQAMTFELAKASIAVKQSQQQLQERANELERMNKLMVGRELKMVELKKIIAKYEQQSVA